MYVRINSVNYTKIKNLSFNPQIDAVSDSIPVNEFDVEIRTDTAFVVGTNIKLYDDRNQLWANFWIKYADEVDDGFVRIKAQSAIGLLDRFKLPATIYTTDVTLQTALNSIFSNISGYASYSLDPELATVTIGGYCPEQTARERLQWVCFVGNAYVKQCFNTNVEIKALDFNSLKTVPINKTYWKPEIEYDNYVTAIELVTYSYRQGTPQQGEESVEVGGVTYIQTEGLFRLTNPNIPQTTAPNVIRIDGVNIINDNNASNIASRLALLYFARKSVKADVVNNKDYVVGERVNVCLDDFRTAVGFIESMNFSFGLQAKSSIDMIVTEMREVTSLVIEYVIYDSDAVIQRKRYNFPVGYHYSIKNEFIDLASNKYRNIYRPHSEYAIGVIRDGKNINTQDVEIALVMVYKTNTLVIKSVSELTFDTKEKVIEIG